MKSRNKSQHITHKYCFYKNCNIAEVILVSIFFLAAAVFLSGFMSSIIFNFPVDLAVLTVVAFLSAKTSLSFLGVKKDTTQPGYLFIKLKSIYYKRFYTINQGQWTNKR